MVRREHLERPSRAGARRPHGRRGIDQGIARLGEGVASCVCEASAAQDRERRLPPLAEGDALTALELAAAEHATRPPARYTEATLVKELEDREIGRPSTYSTIVDTVQARGYVTQLDCQGEDAVFVSRIRKDPTVPHGLSFWCVSDNLRKGAALNAVQIAEMLVAQGMLVKKARLSELAPL